MTNKITPHVFWIPRILAILFISFLALMSLDVISPGATPSQILIGLFMHNIPVFILSAVLAISWKYELVGGIIFIIAGMLYVAQMLMNMLTNPFEGYMLSYVFIVAGPAFLIGTLFLLSWRRKKQNKDNL